MNDENNLVSMDYYHRRIISHASSVAYMALTGTHTSFTTHGCIQSWDTTTRIGQGWSAGAVLCQLDGSSTNNGFRLF